MFLRFSQVGGADAIGPWVSIRVFHRSTVPTIISSGCKIDLLYDSLLTCISRTMDTFNP